jgi:DNA invertase Pin-like site-specific DNA recombinase
VVVFETHVKRDQIGGCMKIGYARVSTEDQNIDLQVDALTAANCEKVYTDKASGAKTDRPALAEMLNFARAGDTVVVYKLDRLGRSLAHLIEVVTGLGARGVGFQSITEGIDTSTPAGRLVFNIFGSIAEFERDLIRERTTAGLAAARARGRKGGRPVTMTPDKIHKARTLAAGNIPVVEICATLGISRATYYREVGSSK